MWLIQLFAALYTIMVICLCLIYMLTGSRSINKKEKKKAGISDTGGKVNAAVSEAKETERIVAETEECDCSSLPRYTVDDFMHDQRLEEQRKSKAFYGRESVPAEEEEEEDWYPLIQPNKETETLCSIPENWKAFYGHESVFKKTKVSKELPLYEEEEEEEEDDWYLPIQTSTMEKSDRSGLATAAETTLSRLIISGDSRATDVDTCVHDDLAVVEQNQAAVEEPDRKVSRLWMTGGMVLGAGIVGYGIYKYITK